jgi:hypothetical protein
MDLTRGYWATIERMNGLTVVVLVLLLLYTLGAGVYIWRTGRISQRRGLTRALLSMIALLVVLDAGFLAIFRDAALTDRGVGSNLLQLLWLPAYAAFWARLARQPVEPSKYPYHASREDKRLIALAMSLPAVAFIAVFALLLLHAFRAVR